MVVWKHYVILFGGFIDVGVKSELFCPLLLSYRDLLRAGPSKWLNSSELPFRLMDFRHNRTEVEAD